MNNQQAAGHYDPASFEFPRRRRTISNEEESYRRFLAQRVIDRARRERPSISASSTTEPVRALKNYEKSILKSNFENYLDSIEVTSTGVRPFISAKVTIEVIETESDSSIHFSSPNVPCPPAPRSYDVSRTGAGRRVSALDSSGVSFDDTPIDLRQYSDETIEEPRTMIPLPLPPRPSSPLSPTLYDTEDEQEESSDDGFPWIDTRAPPRREESSQKENREEDAKKEKEEKDEKKEIPDCVVCLETREVLLMASCSACKQAVCVVCISKFDKKQSNNCPFCRQRNFGWDVYAEMRSHLKKLESILLSRNNGKERQDFQQALTAAHHAFIRDL